MLDAIFPAELFRPPRLQAPPAERAADAPWRRDPQPRAAAGPRQARLAGQWRGAPRRRPARMRNSARERLRPGRRRHARPRRVNPKFGQKLDFIERMTRWSETLAEPTIIVGDFNVAPLECDVWSHKALLNVVSHTPVEVEALTRLQQAHDWVDIGRQFIPAPARNFTWWSYRSPDWTKNDRGRRLDHMWCSPAAWRPCEGARGARALPQLAAAVRPRAADLRDRGLSGDSPVRVAIALLRSGRPVRLAGDKDIAIAAVETTTKELLALRDPDDRARLLISGNRAAALKLANERDAADPEAPVMIERAVWLDAETALAMADAGRDLDRAPLGPLHPIAPDRPEAARAALALARAAGLLPALWVLEPAQSDPEVALDDILRERLQPSVEIVARAKLPLEDMPPTQIVAFRASDDGQEHVALVVGAFGGEPPLVRLHSECLTGDVFGSLKCDCGPQLNEALADHRRGGRRGAALSAPGGPRDRPRQQAPRLCAPGSRTRHRGRQPAARLRRRRARLWSRGGDAARAGDRSRAATDQQSGQGREASKRPGSRSSSASPTRCPPIPTTPIISRPSARRAVTC